MYITSDAAFYKDTIYWGNAPNKRLLMTIDKEGKIKFDHISKEIVGKGIYSVTKFKGIDATVYPTNYALTVYPVVFHFMEALNQSETYSNNADQLNIFYTNRIATFTSE